MDLPKLLDELMTLAKTEAKGSDTQGSSL